MGKPVNIPKSRVMQIVREELTSYLGEILFSEEDDEGDAPKKKGKKEPGKVGADSDNTDKEPETPSDNIAPKRGAEKGPEPADGDQKGAPPPGDADKRDNGEGPPSDQEVPVGDDPADDEIEKDVTDDEPQDPEDVGGDISKELPGKTVQSISFEPESKMMTGAAEITIQFEESPHPLKIMIGKSGMIKYLYKGSLHNEL